MEELIDPPDAPRLGAIPGLLMLGVLVATALTDQISPLEAPRLVGQERAREKALVAKARFGDGSLAALTERHLRMGSRVKRRVVPFWTALITRFARASAEDIIVGQDGWLFLRERVVQPKEARERAVRLSGHLSGAISRRLRAYGSDVVFLPVPRKGAVASSFLPRGLAIDLGLEAALNEALTDSGCAVVDAVSAWGHLEDGAAYLPLDTHWSDVGQSTFASAIARQHPAPKEAVSQELVAAAQRAPAQKATGEASLLDYIGIGQTHPAARVFPQVEVQRVTLPKGTVPTLGDRPWAALVGTSFTADFDFHGHLSLAAGAPIAKTAMAATSFGASLAVLIARSPDDDSAEESTKALPTKLFFEFPVHEIFSLGKGIKRVQLGMTQIFAQLPVQGGNRFEFAPWAEANEAPLQKNARAGQVVQSWPAGEILTSGDGVVSLDIRIESEGPCRWQLRSGGISFSWKAAAGSSRICLPVVEGRDLGQLIELIALDESAASAGASVTILIDADPGRSRPWDANVQVAPHDVLYLELNGAPPVGALTVHAVGQSAGGQRVEQRWAFEQVRSEEAALGLGRFAGGTLRQLSLRTDSGTDVPCRASIRSAP